MHKVNTIDNENYTGLRSIMPSSALGFEMVIFLDKGVMDKHVLFNESILTVDNLSSL